MRNYLPKKEISSPILHTLRYFGIVSSLPVLIIIIGYWYTQTNSPTLTVNNNIEGMVNSITDGDTIHIQTPTGKKLTLRIIGIDTPEKYNVPKPECYAAEASSKATEMLKGKQVSIKTFGVDKYQRTLAIVTIVDNHVIYNEYMIEHGYAFAWTSFSNIPKTMKEKYTTLQNIAKERHIGLWGACEIYDQNGRSKTKAI